jgi:hypothetical protein
MHLLARILFLIFFIPAFAIAQSRITSKDLQIISATTENWSPGIVEKNSSASGGILYQIRAVVRTKTGITIDSMITNKGLISTEVIKGSERNFKGVLHRSDTILIQARLSNGVPPPEISAGTQAVIRKSKKIKTSTFIRYRTTKSLCLAPVLNIKEKAGNSLSK